MLINTTGVIYNILNDPNANLSYKGAEDDLTIMNEVVPLQVLKESGIGGYRDYNYTVGNKDANQTLTTDTQYKLYMKAYRRLVYYNFKDYFNHQLSSMCNALNLNISPYTNVYAGTTYTKLNSFEYEQRDVGKIELQQTLLTNKWNDNSLRVRISGVISECLKYYQNSISMNMFLNLLSLLGIFSLFINGLLELIKDKKYSSWTLWFSSIIILELIALFAFMPEGRPYYLYPMLFVSYLTLLFTLVEAYGGKCNA